MRRAVPLFTLLAGLVAGFMVSREILRREQAPPPPPRDDSARPVRTAIVTFGPERNVLTFTGRTVSPQESLLAFEVTGVVTAMLKREGDVVAIDEPIAALDDRLFRERENEAKAALEIARNEFAAAKDVPSMSKVQISKLEETVAARRAAHDAAVLSREKCTMLAPFPGVVTARTAEVGWTAVPGAPAFRLSVVNPIRVRIGVPEHLIPQVREGQPATLAIDAYPDDPPRDGVVKLVGRAPLEGSLLFPVDVELTNADGRLFLGLIARAEIVVGTFERAARIPLSATFVNAGKRMVFVVRDDRAVKVPLGGVHGRGVDLIVTEESLAGAELILDGHRILLEGNRIERVD